LLPSARGITLLDYEPAALQFLDYLAGRLRGLCQHVFVLKGDNPEKKSDEIHAQAAVVEALRLNNRSVFAKRIQAGPAN
jgi:hypothetical protein